MEAPAEGRVGACPHCGTAVEGAEDEFCCTGCAHAWDIIHGAGLDDYYARRDALPEFQRTRAANKRPFSFGALAIAPPLWNE